MDLDIAHRKLDALCSLLKTYGRAAVAFSGGVDSAFLLYSAKTALGGNVIAVTADSEFFPPQERREAAGFCSANQIRQIIFRAEALQNPAIRQNPPNRCYLCKRMIFQRILEIAAGEGFDVVAEGSNTDDTGDYRPGMQAIAELGIRSPLRDVSLTKAEIRQLSKAHGLPTWDKPSLACLASRIPYGDPVTAEKLRMADSAEQFLRGLGFRQVRCRVHGNVARIEVLPEVLPEVLAHRSEITDSLRAIGFRYVTVDLTGYRTGSLNEVL